MRDTDKADDRALITNTLSQAESQLPNLERAAGAFGLYVNVNKTKFMFFQKEKTIST